MVPSPHDGMQGARDSCRSPVDILSPRVREDDGQPTAQGAHKSQTNLVPPRRPFLPSYYGGGSGINHPGSSGEERLKVIPHVLFSILKCIYCLSSRGAGVRHGPSGPKPEAWENQKFVPFSGTTTEKSKNRREISMDSIEEPKSLAEAAWHQLDANHAAAQWCEQTHLFARA